MTAHYDRVISAAMSQPWALMASKIAEIRAFLTLKAAGLTLSEDEIKARIGAEKKPAGRVEPTGDGGSIAVVPVFGVIANRMDMISEFSGGTSVEKLTAQLRALASDPSVSAIVLDVNSPGGSALGMEEIAAEIRALRQQKPIVAVAGPLMASAAYNIGASTSELVVTPSGLVGSIGVFTLHEDHSGELAEAGVKVTVISAGKYKTEGNPFGPLDEEAKAASQAEIDYLYAQFTSDVAKGRGVAVSTVRNGFGEGRVVNAKEAVKLKMADRIATLDDVLSELLVGGGVLSATSARSAVAYAHAAELIGIDLAEEPDVVAQTEVNLAIGGVTIPGGDVDDARKVIQHIHDNIEAKTAKAQTKTADFEPIPVEIPLSQAELLEAAQKSVLDVEVRKLRLRLLEMGG